MSHEVNSDLTDGVREACEWLEQSRSPYHADRSARATLSRLSLYRHRLLQDRARGDEVPPRLPELLDRLAQAVKDADLTPERRAEVLRRLGTFESLVRETAPRKRP